jgi:hypothetical protein
LETILRDAAQGKFFWVLISMIVFSWAVNAPDHAKATVAVQELARNMPQRSSEDFTGSQFVNYVSEMNPQQREQAIRDEILKGNFPEFLRKLVPVELRGELPHGQSVAVTIFVAPDYLAIGSDDDFLRIPMNLYSAVVIADHFGFILPTKKMVDAIYLQSRYHFVPQPLPAGPEMRSTAYYWIHNQMIEKQARALGVRLGELVSGDKKDVVITNLLSARAGRIAIYGWHKGPGEPIQPLSTVHGAHYADYSHGIRLVSKLALIDGRFRSIDEILQDTSISGVLSDEGPIRDMAGFLPLHEDSSPIGVAAIN